MGKRGKSSVFLLFLLVLISLACAGGAYYLWQQEKSKSASLEKDLEGIKSKQKSLMSELDNSKKTISDLESKLRDSQDQAEKLNNDLALEKSAKEEALTKVDGLKSALSLQEKQTTDLANQIASAQDEVKKLKVQLKDLEVKKGDLEAKVKELLAKESPEGQDVELGTIVVNPENPTSPETKVEEEKVVLPSGLEGKVLTVNREYDFVVVNLGSKDGIKIGNLFSVYSGDKYLGDVKVEKLHDSMCAASFVADPKNKDLKNKVNEGNKVVRKAK